MQNRAAGGGECTLIAGTVVLNSTVMLPRYALILWISIDEFRVIKAKFLKNEQSVSRIRW